MQKIVRLPQVELNLENATVVEVFRSEGEKVGKDDILLTIETQKATEDLPCGEDGYVRALLVKEGDEVNVHDALAVLTDEPDEPFDIPQKEKAEKVGSVERAPESSGREQTRAGRGDGKVRAVPAARKRARVAGIELAEVSGTGPGGRITVADVEAHIQGTGDTGSGERERKPLSVARKALINQMERGHKEIPQISISRFMEVTSLTEKQEGVTFTVCLVDAVARALANHEILRTVLEREHTWVADVSVAVAMDTRRGLVAPVIREADGLSLEEISNLLKDFRRRAEENRLKGEDLRGGHFALSNLGMLGVDQFTPMVFAGQTAVLGVGRAVDAGEGRKSAWCTLAVDHRLVDGAEAARFLETLQRLILEKYQSLGSSRSRNLTTEGAEARRE